METVKIYLNDTQEIRKFSWYKAGRFDDLLFKVRAMFAIPEGVKVTLGWRDEENDLIHLSSDEELQLMVALQEIIMAKSGTQMKLFAYTTTKSAPSAVSACGFVHAHVICDGCNVTPIHGNRFKCLKCPDYDLCETCLRRGEHAKHNMLLLRNDIDYRAYVQQGQLQVNKGDGAPSEMILDFTTANKNTTREEYEALGQSLTKLFADQGIRCDFSVEGSSPRCLSRSPSSIMAEKPAASASSPGQSSGMPPSQPPYSQQSAPTVVPPQQTFQEELLKTMMMSTPEVQQMNLEAVMASLPQLPLQSIPQGVAPFYATRGVPFPAPTSTYTCSGPPPMPTTLSPAAFTPSVSQPLDLPENVRSSRGHMLNMGYSDADGRLTALLLRHNGDISSCLDELQKRRDYFSH
jgi:hypothetical protein